MARPNPVKFVEVCKVAPQPSSSPKSDTPPQCLPLTLFDLLWLRFAPVERLFFYEISPSTFINNPSFFHSILIPKLKISLSLTLQHFLPLAGSLTWPQDSPKPILAYVRGDTVSLSIAQSDHHYFNHLISSSNNKFDIEAKEYHPLVPQLEASHELAAAMAFQVTIFPNRGFCIGTSMHHAILDGKASTMFVKAWAHICKHIVVDHESDSNILLPDHLKPFFDRSVIRDPTGLEPIFLNQFLNMDRPNNRSLMFVHMRKAPPPDSVRGTFVFTRRKIEALKQLVKEKRQQQHLSTFCVTCAYAWICLLKAKKVDADQTAAMMGFAVDSRSRLDPPIPATYLGNCVSGRAVVAETKELIGEDGLTVAVNAISEAIKSLDTDDGGLLNGAETWIPIMYTMRTDESLLFSLAGSPRFGIYETDFGWGRPNKVEVVSIERSGAMSLSESKGSGAAGGVEIGLVLKKHQMEAFATLFAEGLTNL